MVFEKTSENCIAPNKTNMKNKKTLVMGASPNPARYSNKAIKRLLAKNVEVVAIGKRVTNVHGITVIKGMPDLDNIHTVTLYLSPDNQEEYLDYFISLKPKRIIFNPGTINRKLEKMAIDAGIETLEDCTLIMLDTGDY
jgi:uncharacterized protein